MLNLIDSETTDMDSNTDVEDISGNGTDITQHQLSESISSDMISDDADNALESSSSTTSNISVENIEPVIRE